MCLFKKNITFTSNKGTGSIFSHDTWSISVKSYLLYKWHTGIDRKKQQCLHWDEGKEAKIILADLNKF